MKAVVFSCDRCGHAQPRDRKFTDGERWMRTVSVVVQDGHFEHSHGSRLPGSDVLKDAMWCDHCCAELGLTKSPPATSADTPPPPSLEDVIREIVREEIGSAGQ